MKKVWLAEKPTNNLFISLCFLIFSPFLFLRLKQSFFFIPYFYLLFLSRHLFFCYPTFYSFKFSPCFLSKYYFLLSFSLSFMFFFLFFFSFLFLFSLFHTSIFCSFFPNLKIVFLFPPLFLLAFSFDGFFYYTFYSFLSPHHFFFRHLISTCTFIFSCVFLSFFFSFLFLFFTSLYFCCFFPTLKAVFLFFTLFRIAFFFRYIFLFFFYSSFIHS